MGLTEVLQKLWKRKAIQKWGSQYKAHGVDGLISRYTYYSGEFKMDVLNYMKDNRTSILETAAIFNISAPSTISQ